MVPEEEKKTILFALKFNHINIVFYIDIQEEQKKKKLIVVRR